MCASWDNPGIAVISRESRDTLTEGNDPMIVCRSILFLHPLKIPGWLQLL